MPSLFACSPEGSEASSRCTSPSLEGLSQEFFTELQEDTIQAEIIRQKSDVISDEEFKIPGAVGAEKSTITEGVEGSTPDGGERIIFRKDVAVSVLRENDEVRVVEGAEHLCSIVGDSEGLFEDPGEVDEHVHLIDSKRRFMEFFDNDGDGQVIRPLSCSFAMHVLVTSFRACSHW